MWMDKLKTDRYVQLVARCIDVSFDRKLPPSPEKLLIAMAVRNLGSPQRQVFNHIDAEAAPGWE